MVYDNQTAISVPVETRDKARSACDEMDLTYSEFIELAAETLPENESEEN